MIVYADTSFIVSLYGQDINSASAVHVLKQLQSPLSVSWLNTIESRNAIRQAVFRRDITMAQCKAVLSIMEADMRADILKETSVNGDALFNETERLSARHTAAHGNRTIDVLHVAFALVIQADVFLTFDRRQKKLAEKSGLNVYT